MSTGLRARWRQWRQPRAFRIAAPAWDAGQRARLAEVVAAWGATAERPDPAAPAVGNELDEPSLAEAGTALWRARRRVDATTDTTRETRQTRRLLRTSEDALAQAGLVLQDHTGDPYHPGLSLDVLAVEDDPDLDTEVVRDTVKPTVYLGRRRIQRGQVVVGRPPGPRDTPPTGE